MRKTLHPPVFLTAAAFILATVVLTMLAPVNAQAIFSHLQAWILENASWFYILTVAIILLAVVYLAISRYGDIKLGPDHSQPDYRDVTWFAMLFSAGMGIGLMFFGVAEPVMHYISPPAGEAGTVDAAREAMKITFFHWGLHAWAIYAVVGLTLSYFSYRHGLPLTLRSALYPLIGERIYGPIGHTVDVFAIIGTVFGIATSLGLGVAQINSGLNHLFGVPVTITTQILLIIGASLLAMLSVASGLDRGIRILSETNLALAVALMLFVLALGPTVFILQTFVQNTGAYLSDLVNKTFNLYAYQPNDWIGGWTLFYWGWWIAWSPFVGLFIARISRGRTIREFVRGVLLVPTGFTLIWMSVFGDTAIHLILVQHIPGFADVVAQDSALALFAFLEQLPLPAITSFIAIIMVLVFFVTSADSGALGVDLLASNGAENSPVWQRIFWSLLMGVVAIALLLTDGLEALQTATIASALPFSIILLLSLWGVFKALKLDATKRRIRYQTITRTPVPSQREPWQRRLRNIVRMPRQEHVLRYISEIARPAMQAVAQELCQQGYDAELVDAADAQPATLFVRHQGEYLDFSYAVLAQEHVRPLLNSQDSTANAAERRYFRAEVFLLEGGQDYDIMGWTLEAVISDILDQYDRHRQYLHMVHGEPAQDDET